MSKPPPTPTSPATKESASQAANSIRVPRATRPRRRVNSPPARRPDFEFRRTESKHPSATRRKSCCERWFGRRGSKKRKKKCKKKCKTRKKKRKKRKKRTRRK